MTTPTRGRGRPRKAAQPEIKVEEVTEESVQDQETDDQRQIRELKAQLAAIQDRQTVPVDTVEHNPDADDYVVIHFLIDGFTHWDRVWLRGQEVHVKRGGRAWATTVNSNGESWLDLTDEQQLKKWKKIVFRRGPVTVDIFASFTHVNDAKDVKLDKGEWLGDKVLARSVLD